MSESSARSQSKSEMINVVCALIENDEGCVFAAQRPNNKHLGGKWEFPGGKVEIGEDEATALVRELNEELGIHVVITAKLLPCEHNYEDFTIRLHPFGASIVEGEPIAHEHSATQWVSREEIRQLDWAPADLPIIDQWLNQSQ